MSDLNSFAELIRKGKEEKRLKDIQEQERTIAKNAPLLSDLFKTVSNAKRIEEKRQAVVAKVDELEANQVTQEDIDELVTEKIEQVSTEAEKKLAAIVKKLQEDITNLKRHVDSKPSYTMAASGGSGEVRILRMDDVVRGTPQNGAVLTWDSTLNKFKFVVPLNNDGSTTDEEMPYAKRVDFITDNELYKGEAAVGTTDGQPFWRLHKIVIGNDNDVTETWAGGNADFDKVWADRLTYNYT